MTGRLIPTEQEAQRWLLETLRHSMHVEYFLYELKLGNRDPERPFDIIGIGNKYELEVVKGMALQYREPKVDFKIHISPSVELHRQQYHHRMWNLPSPKATQEDLFEGAIDAICANLEGRIYFGGAYDYNQALFNIEDLKTNTQSKINAARIIVPEMRKLKQLNLGLITGLSDFPNLGVSKDCYDEMFLRTQEACELLAIFK
ncbi:MAG: hypothetical protein AABX17_00070 [Nanoarchaeota archaeon]